MSFIVFKPMKCLRCGKNFDYEEEFELCEACQGEGCYECYGEGQLDVSEFPPLCPICYQDEYGDDNETL